MNHTEVFGESYGLLGLLITTYALNCIDINNWINNVYTMTKNKDIRQQFKCNFIKDAKEIKSMLFK